MKNIKRWLIIITVLAMLPFSLPARAEKTEGVVRVLLTRLKLTDRIELSLDGSYTLGALAFQRGSDLVISCKSGTLMVYYEGMTMDAGKSLVLLRHGVTDGKENGLRINGAYELHPGDLHLSIQAGQLQAVLHAPMEEYLLGVVPYEMSDSFPLEALKAQAITARTYALRKAGSHKDYDVVDNTNDQAYYGVKAAHTNAARAVQETRGICGYYKGKLAECYYSASNGGQTELVHHVWGSGGDYGYLMMTDDPYDLENKESVVKTGYIPKVINTHQDLGPIRDAVLGALSETLEARGYDSDTDYILVTAIEKAELTLPLYTDSPSRIMTLLKLSLQVEGRRLIMAGAMDEDEEISIFSMSATPTPQPQEQWTEMAPLPQPVTIALDVFPLIESAYDLSINGGNNEIITVTETDDFFRLESRRFGHGVGMSQRGAQCMAGDYDWNYAQILRFYYPGMNLKTLDYTHTIPKPLSQTFLSTPGPAATPTPRPTPAPLQATPGPREYLVTVTNIGVNSYLNMRAQANTQSDVLRQLYYGQQLIVVEDLGDWIRVRTDDVTGFVMRQFVHTPDELEALRQSPAP